MYQLVSAIVKPFDNNGRWRSMDIGNVHFNDLYRDFKRVLVTLSHPVLPHNVSLDLESLRADLGADRVTVNDWLVLNGNKTLPTSNELPLINTRYAKFSDAVRSGYHLRPIHPTISEDSPLPLEEKPDLLMTKGGVSYEFVHQYALANVNGFYHLTDWSPKGVYVVDGNKSWMHSGRNEVGLLSFLELGKIELIRITEEMIYTHQNQQKLRFNCYLDTGVDLSQKSVMLVLGGYLHVLDPQVFFRISETAFGINFSNIPLVDRYYESHLVLDLSELGMVSSPNNDKQISIDNLYSDAVLTKYLTMSQSFFVVLDNTDLFLDTIELKNSPFPGCYTTAAADQPIYPLVVGRGKHEVYWPRKEHDRFSVNVHASATWHAKPLYETVRTNKQKSVDDSQIPVDGYTNWDASFLLIGSDV